MDCSRPIPLKNPFFSFIHEKKNLFVLFTQCKFPAQFPSSSLSNWQTHLHRLRWIALWWKKMASHFLEAATRQVEEIARLHHTSTRLFLTLPGYPSHNIRPVPNVVGRSREKSIPSARNTTMERNSSGIRHCWFVINAGNLEPKRNARRRMKCRPQIAMSVCKLGNSAV